MSYILWTNNYTEGWGMDECDTIEECYKTAIGRASTDFLITPPAIKVEFTEAQHD